MKYARNVNNTAVDVRTESPDGCFTADIAAQFVQVPDTVENGWILNGQTWEAPPAPVIPDPVEPVAIPPKVSPVEFMLLFTAAERVGIKAARATNPVIDDFLDIVDDTRLTHVDLGLTSTQEAVGYLALEGLIAEARIPVILSGVVQ